MTARTPPTTTFLAWVRDCREAERAAEGGVDGVLFVQDPGTSPDGLEEEIARTIGVLGDLLIVGRRTGTGDRGEIWLHGAPAWDRAPEGPVLAAFRDALPSADDLDDMIRIGLNGIMIEASTRLVDRLDLVDLAATIRACRARGLACGLSGGIELPDLPRLLALEPALLAMDRWLRAGAGPDAPLDPGAITLARDLIPRGATKVAGTPAPQRPRLDRIFVRDLVLDMAIGAYAGEVGRTQRVRFTVEADLLGSGRPARDMRDIVSYDLMTDAIRRIAGAGHVAFVETLAETIAADVLSHPRVQAVHVVVEKLDLGPGSVGVDIWRDKGPYG